jgi:hypothetical protein
MGATTTLERCSTCYRRHRSWRARAQCRWPRAEWIVGNNRFASVSYCPRGTTVMLYADRVGAEKAKRVIDRLGCGGQCFGWPGHKVIDLGAV